VVAEAKLNFFWIVPAPPAVVMRKNQGLRSSRPPEELEIEDSVLAVQ